MKIRLATRFPKLRLPQDLASFKVSMIMAAVVASIFGVVTIGQAHEEWGNTPENHNYVIHPPVDGAPPGAGQDGARLSFVIDNSTGSAGTTLAYLPHQYLVASTRPYLVFEMRGGYWNVNGGHDRYDRDDANANWTVNVSKENGYLSPFYYEVYQLRNGNPQDGRLLGIINPRDRNVFPTTDNNPNGNGNCLDAAGNAGQCWRSFYISTSGGAITLNGAPQDSCSQRIGTGNPCFEVRRDNNRDIVHTADHVWVVRQNNTKQHTGGGDTPHSHHNPNNPSGDTSQLHHNDDAHDQFNTNPDNYQASGNCFWDWLAPTDFNGNDSGATHRHTVWCGQFEDNVPVGYAGPHTHPDGSGITNAEPTFIYQVAGLPTQYFLDDWKLQYYNRDPNNYQAGGNCFWGWLGDFPDGDKNHTHSVYCYDRQQGDGGINDARFAGVDSSDTTGRFNSSSYPNLNGDYVFLIKVVHWQDVNHGYVTNFNDIVPKGTKFGGCPIESDGNQTKCPGKLLEDATDRGVAGGLIQNGFYLRTPKDVDGGKSFIASAPNRLSFGVSYGPAVVGSSGEKEYEDMTGQSYRGLRFQAGGAGCRADDWANYGPTLSGDQVRTSGPVFKVGNADWDSGYWNPPFRGFEGNGPAGDDNINAQVERLGVSDENGALTGKGPYNPPNGISKAVGDAAISGTWKSYPGWAISLDAPYPGRPNPPNAFADDWKTNEQFTGRFDIHNWNDGNLLYQGGAPFTWGYWPTCLGGGGSGPTVSMNALTPKENYTYNGRDIFNPSSNTNQAAVDFVFQYNLPETRGKVDYWVEIDGQRAIPTQTVISGQGTNGHGASAAAGQSTVRIPIDASGLAANTNHTWRACINPGPLDVCTSTKNFRVNKGPSAALQQTTRNTGRVNYKCSLLAHQLNDPESHEVRPHYSVSWTSGGHTNVVSTVNTGGQHSDVWGDWLTRTANYAYGANGTSFTSDELRPKSWWVDGVPRAVPSKTMSAFLQDDVPDGIDVTWYAMGEDRYGASDVQGWPNPTFTNVSNPKAAVDSSSPATYENQPAMNYRRFGPATATTYHKNSPATFLTESSKKFRDLAGSETTNVADGETVQVETKIKNTGETPAKNYQILDYLGAARDFERPGDFKIQKGSGAVQSVSPVVEKVNPKAHTTSTDDQVLTGTLTSLQASTASWRINFGKNGGGIVPGGELAPGETITVTYYVRVNRNQDENGGVRQSFRPDEPGTNFNRKLDLAASGMTYSLIEFQKDYCDDAAAWTTERIALPTTAVRSPWLKATRGNVHSNDSIGGYLSGEENATFVVTANGSISHFTGGLATIGGYNAESTSCSPAGDLDWRKEMYENIQKLLDRPHNSSAETQALLNGASVKKLNPSSKPNVWIRDGDLNIAGNKQFSGVGTIVVKGDLNIDGNLSYDTDTTGINSLGIIVLGDVHVDSSVTNLVGTYYVSDIKTDLSGDSSGCPDTDSGSGSFSSGRSNNRLDVLGALVARQFNFQRYFTDETDTTSDPAENVYYDGRVVAATPPGFGTFRNTAAWYEIAP